MYLVCLIRLLISQSRPVAVREIVLKIQILLNNWAAVDFWMKDTMVVLEK